MSARDTGLLVFEPGKPQSKDALYDSRKPRINIDLRPTNPKHLDIIPNVQGGTALAVPVNTRQEETLMVFPHGKKFTPECFVYFYVQTYDGSTTSTKAGKYGGGAIFYSGTLGTVEDKIYMEVDSQNLYIKHSVDNTLFGSTYTSDANKYRLRVKYYITSNDSHVAQYTEGDVLA